VIELLLFLSLRLQLIGSAIESKGKGPSVPCYHPAALPPERRIVSPGSRKSLSLFTVQSIWEGQVISGS